MKCPASKGAALLAAASCSSRACAAQQKDYEPHVGQQGKDVVWVPTPDEVVERMLVMAQTKPDDFVIDLGAGDGKIAIAAAKKFGARSLGIEYNPDMAAYAQRNVKAAGVTGGRTSSRATSSPPISPRPRCSPCTCCPRST